MNNEYLSINQFCEALGIKRHIYYYRLGCGLFPPELRPLEIGGRHMWKKETVDRYLKKNTEKTELKNRLWVWVKKLCGF